MFDALIHNNEFWVAVAFVTFLVIAWRPMHARANAALDARTEAIRAELDEAQRLREDASRALADCQRKQQDALQQAKNIIALAQAEADRAAEQGRLDLAAALERRRRIAVERIALEEQQAVAEVRNLAVDVAVAAASQLLAGNLDKTRRTALIERAIQDLPGRLQ